MAVARINRRNRALDLVAVRARLGSATRDDADWGVEVCAASKADWICYVKSESQAFRSRNMLWVDGTLLIIEFSGWVNGKALVFLRQVMREATGTGFEHLEPAGASFVESMAFMEPDDSFGPVPSVGAPVPEDFAWAELHTLKVEVGVFQPWAVLDHKAEQWSRFPGVQYVLCLRIAPDVSKAEFRLLSVRNGAIERPAMPATEIVDPTTVAFDSRRLLGIEDSALPLPTGFTDRAIVLDLWPVVAELRARRDAA